MLNCAVYPGAARQRNDSEMMFDALLPDGGAS
jgi:hypothetical protein